MRDEPLRDHRLDIVAILRVISPQFRYHHVHYVQGLQPEIDEATFQTIGGKPEGFLRQKRDSLRYDVDVETVSLVKLRSWSGQGQQLLTSRGREIRSLEHISVLCPSPIVGLQEQSRGPKDAQLDWF